MSEWIFNTIMWALVKVKICDKIIITTIGKNINAYVKKGDYL